ncbi:MAG: hypothetical protein V1773_18495 [bacterium]
MFSKYFSNLDGASSFGIIAFLIFFSLFIGVIIWLFTTNNEYFIKMGNIPLEGNELTTKNEKN